MPWNSVPNANSRITVDSQEAPYQSLYVPTATLSAKRLINKSTQANNGTDDIHSTDNRGKNKSGPETGC
jgi:hypothetical protein